MAHFFFKNSKSTTPSVSNNMNKDNSVDAKKNNDVDTTTIEALKKSPKNNRCATTCRFSSELSLVTERHGETSLTSTEVKRNKVSRGKL